MATSVHATTDQLDVEVADGVLRATFRRPEALNALSEEMVDGLLGALDPRCRGRQGAGGRPHRDRPGVGPSLCFAADLAVATESASFLLAFSRVGLMPDGGATLTVAAAVGRARAMRMALLAEPLTARGAHEAGLVSHVVPEGTGQVVLFRTADAAEGMRAFVEKRPPTFLGR